MNTQSTKVWFFLDLLNLQKINLQIKVSFSCNDFLFKAIKIMQYSNIRWS